MFCDSRGDSVDGPTKHAVRGGLVIWWRGALRRYFEIFTSFIGLSYQPHFEAILMGGYLKEDQ